MPLSQKAVTESSNLLAHALDKNQVVQESVEQSAAELLVVSAVLSQEIPDEVKTEEVTQAICRTEELEDRLQSSADELEMVNKALKNEISVRRDLERQLAVAQVKLGQAQPHG